MGKLGSWIDRMSASHKSKLIDNSQEKKMSDLKSQFDVASQAAKKLARRPDNETLLKLYALYKQATQGDASGKRPGFTDPVGRAKYDAWTQHKGVSKEQAMQAYIELVKTLNK